MSRKFFFRITLALLALTGLINLMQVIHILGFSDVVIFLLSPVLFVMLTSFLGYKFSMQALFQDSLLLLSWLVIPLHFFITYITLTDSYGLGAATLIAGSIVFILAYITFFFLLVLFLEKHKERKVTR